MAIPKPPLMDNILRLIAAKRVVVRGWSMYPTLHPNEYVLFDRLAYRRSEPGRGDIVLAAHPMHRRFLMIKRVLALPGDIVEVQGERLLVNGEPGGSPQPRRRKGVPAYGDAQWKLNDGEYFLVGDEPSRSTDSRQIGPFPRDHIRARAWRVYWPISRWRIIHS